jgi:hypothetical protein
MAPRYPDSGDLGDAQFASSSLRLNMQANTQPTCVRLRPSEVSSAFP